MHLKNKSIVATFSFLLLLFFNTVKLYSQDSATNSIYDWFDSKVGKENLAINNGKLLLNYDRVLNNNNRFYFSNYLIGTVFYDNQVYNNVILNYDILNDNIIIKPFGENDKNPIILIKDKVNYFSADGKKYVNLDSFHSITSNFISGYYEESFVGNQLALYTKHVKTKSEKINGDAIYDDFTEKTLTVFLYKSEYYQINSKKSITTIFPEYKKVINEFYSKNSYLEKSDKTLFLTNLFNYLNDKIQ
jgi:hypothetical protein